MATPDRQMECDLPVAVIIISSAFEASQGKARFRATLARKREQYAAIAVLSDAITVFPQGANRYLLVDGYCTFLLAQERGQRTIPAKIQPANAYAYAPSWIWHQHWKSLAYHCAYCGIPLLWQRPETMPKDLYHRFQPTRDHVVPRAGGGSDRPENLRIACRRCNEAKGRKKRWTVPDAFRREAEQHRNEWLAAGWITQSEASKRSRRG